MPTDFETPQDAEDAFYDAIEERDAARLRAVWEDSPEVACLLPMQPLLHGEQVHEALAPVINGEIALDIKVRHIRWVEAGDIAIHYVDEQVVVPGRQPQPPVYATNVYRRGESGWHMILHQNSPTPPPPGMGMPPGMPPTA
jgi:ketosteroid isomerase-like protein